MVALQPENSYTYSDLNQQGCIEFRNDTIDPD